MKKKTKKRIHKGWGLDDILEQLIEAIRVYAKRCEDPEIEGPLKVKGRLEKLNKLLEDYDKAKSELRMFIYEDFDSKRYIKLWKKWEEVEKALLVFIAENNGAFWD